MSRWVVFGFALAACSQPKGSRSDGGTTDDAALDDASLDAAPIDALPPCDGPGCPIVDECHPLDDNDFDGAETALSKPGTSCTAGQGCYGLPKRGPTRTHWTCENEINANRTLRNRATYNDPTIFLNGCNQGYIPLLSYGTGSFTAICSQLCSPGNTYLGNPGTQYPTGKAPHRCDGIDGRGEFGHRESGTQCRIVISGTFGPQNTDSDGDGYVNDGCPPINAAETQCDDAIDDDGDTYVNDGCPARVEENCVFMWRYELDDFGNWFKPQTGDTLGVCVEHSYYLYDSNNDTTPDTPYPRCQDVPLTSSGTELNAVDLGCVDSATAGLEIAPYSRPRVDLGVVPGNLSIK